MSADRKILLIAGLLSLVVCVATGITSELGWLRVLAGVAMLYAFGVVIVAVTGMKEDAP